MKKRQLLFSQNTWDKITTDGTGISAKVSGNVTVLCTIYDHCQKLNQRNN